MGTQADKRPKPSQNEIINLQKLISMISGSWYYFLISVAVASIAAFFYLEYTLPIYRVTTTILIEEEDNSILPGADNMLQGIGLRPGSQNLDNQIDILTSRTIIRKTLDKLPFEVDCYKKGLFKKLSFYPLDPIDVIPNFDSFIRYDQEFSVRLLMNDMIQIEAKDKIFAQLDTIVTFGSRVSFQGGSLIILPNPMILKLFDPKQKIYFTIYSSQSTIEYYRELLEIQTTSIDGSIVELAIEGTNKTKDKIFLDKLTEVYMASLLAKKNREANRIIEFIDEQLIDVSDSLVITENRLQEFRSKNRIMDISAQAQQIIDQAVLLENEKARLSLISNYYEYLTEYLSADNIQEAPIAPASMGIEDPLLAALIQDLWGLQAEYYSRELGDRNPVYSQLEQRIANTKQSLRETLQGIQRANTMAKDENNDQIQRLNLEASSLPSKERKLLGIEREFNLNNVLYTFLLQRRAESQIQKASNKPDVELIDPATAEILPVSPNKLVVYLLALIVGIGLPLFVLKIGDSLRFRISSEEDLQNLTSLPIVGYIPHSRLSYNTVVLNEPQSRISEAFRSLRTRMDFFTRDIQSPVILVTSTMAGEGKTFTAVNLASAYSLVGKKTVLVGFDLRRPNFPSSISHNGEEGLSTYLIGKNSMSEIIFSTDFQNLHIIPSGPVPPNPGELSASNKLQPLFDMLKEKYDFIIVDSAPIGSVSDSYSVANLSDANVILVRHGKTVKRFLKATLTEAEGYGIKGLSLLVNDFRLNSSSHRYTYNPKYDYNKH